MKECNKCGEKKEDGEFQTLKILKKSGEPCKRNTCKVCMQKYYKVKQTENRRKLKEELIELLGGVCSTCGRSFHPAAMDIHHENPAEKEDNWADLRLVGTVKQHISSNHKLICSNCHRKHHAEENGWYV